MNLYRSYIGKIAAFLSMMLAFPSGLFAQGQAEKEVLLGEIRDLLGKYEFLAASIREDARQDPVRPFIQLFRNPRVMVYDDLNENEGAGQISIRDYAEKIRLEFPEGLDINIDTARIRLDYHDDDQQASRLVEVRVHKTISGSSDSTRLSKSVKLDFRIGYDIIDGEFRNFLIHGILPVRMHEHELLISASPGLSRIYNQGLLVDQRFDIPWGLSWQASLRYQYMINESWGLGAGFNGIVFNNDLHLDKFDPLRGKDPNIIDIHWNTEFYYLEMPVYGIYRIKPAGRLEADIHLGIFLAYRVFENITTKGRNFHSGQLMEGVVSDPFNYENISSFDSGLEVSANINYAVNRRIGFFAGIGIRQGFVTMGKDAGQDYPYSIYQGQANPQFYDLDFVNLSQLFPAEIGIRIKLSGKDKIN